MIALLLAAHLALAQPEPSTAAPDEAELACACEVPPEPPLSWMETAWAAKEEVLGPLLALLIGPYGWAWSVGRAIRRRVEEVDPSWWRRLLPSWQVQQAVEQLLAERASAPSALGREQMATLRAEMEDMRSRGITEAEREILLSLAVLLDPTLPEEELRRRLLGGGRAG